MALSLISLNYTSQDLSGATTYLRGNLFKKLTVNAVVELQTFVIPNDANNVIFGDSTYQTRDYITDDITQRFIDFQVGDTIELVGITGVTNATYEVLQKISNGTIRVQQVGGGAVVFGTDVVATDGVIRVIDEPVGISFDYSLIENDSPTSFLSPVDGQLNRYQYNNDAGIPAVYNAMTAFGTGSNQIGSTRVRRVSYDAVNEIRRYEIEQVLFIHPFFLTNQLIQYLNGQKPSYFDLGKSLKHVFRIRTYRDNTEPNIFSELVVDQVKGDVGFTRENCNGGPSKFTLSSVVYNNSIDQLQLNTPTQVTININELDLAGKYATINFICLPEQDSDFRNNTRTMTQNYVFDRVQLLAGAAPVNGDNFGGTLQVITAAELDSAAGVSTVKFTADFGTLAKQIIGGRVSQRYLIAVNIWSDLQTQGRSDEVLIDIPIKSFGIETGGVVEITSSLLRHDINSVIDGDEFPIVMSEEELVGNTLITVDTNNFDTALLKNVTAQIVAVVGGQTSVLAEQFFDLNGSPVIGGATLANVNIPTGFNVLPSEIRYNYSLLRETASDSAGVFAYRLLYPFIFRFEYWRELVLAQRPVEFFDTNEDFNGYNHNWDRLGSFGDLFYRVITTTEVNGITRTDIKDTPLEHYTYEENPDWINETIEVFDLDGNQLDFSGTPYFKAGEKVRVVVSAESTVGNVVPGRTVMYVRLYKKEVGDHKDSLTYSNIYDRTSISGALENAGGFIYVSVSGPVVTGEFLVDGDKLSQSDYTLSCLIKSPVTIGAPIETLEIYYENIALMAFEVQVAVQTPGATIAYGQFTTPEDCFVTNGSIGFTPFITSVQLSNDGINYNLPLPYTFPAGSTIYYLVTFGGGNNGVFTIN
ncbi:MAG TPA: hypothetical protein VFV37_11110 [Luteibaculaceae bacterium]|nr:hypothetical protein [Luteibaculaceae bacterium]